MRSKRSDFDRNPQLVSSDSKLLSPVRGPCIPVLGCRAVQRKRGRGPFERFPAMTCIENCCDGRFAADGHRSKKATSVQIVGCLTVGKLRREPTGSRWLSERYHQSHSQPVIQSLSQEDEHSRNAWWGLWAPDSSNHFDLNGKPRPVAGFLKSAPTAGYGRRCMRCLLRSSERACVRAPRARVRPRQERFFETQC